MKLNVGDYVRTENGIIDKVIIEYNGHCASRNCTCKHVSCERDYYDEEKIIKSSSNIIDLIEEGDYINGHKVIYTIGNINKKIYVEYVNMNKLLEIKLEQIASIVTKEQFKSMQYHLESEVN